MDVGDEGRAVRAGEVTDELLRGASGDLLEVGACLLSLGGRDELGARLPSISSTVAPAIAASVVLANSMRPRCDGLRLMTATPASRASITHEAPALDARRCRQRSSHGLIHTSVTSRPRAPQARRNRGMVSEETRIA
jgi:hypothetical protein